MNGQRFDDLTRTLATPVRRRAVATALAGGALAALLGGHAQEATAKKRKRRKKKKNPPICRPNCAGKSCGDADDCGGTCTDCPSGQRCQGGQCVPDECNPPCRGAHFCQNGSCVCPSGMKSCDINFCGECCSDAECPGFPGPHRQRCWYINDDTAHCACGPRLEPPCPDGRCGTCCNDAFCELTQGPGRFCTVNLTCACREGLTYCSTELGCVDTMTNRDACGQFCKKCDPGWSCVNGACCTNECGTKLIPGMPCCTGTCVNKGTDPEPQFACE